MQRVKIKNNSEFNMDILSISTKSQNLAYESKMYEFCKRKYIFCIIDYEK